MRFKLGTPFESGLRRLTEKLNREGRGKVYWPLHRHESDSDEFDLDKYLEQHGRFRRLPKQKHRELYRPSFGFGRQLFLAQKNDCKRRNQTEN